jgi:hypothetical protein
MAQDNVDATDGNPAFPVRIYDIAAERERVRYALPLPEMLLTGADAGIALVN